MNARVRTGFSLAETAVSVVIVGVLVVAALNTVGASTMAQQAMGHRGKAELLAHGLMSEILQQAYEDPTMAGTFGAEPDERITGNRSLYDDVDDYHRWNASPPQNRDGTAIPDLGGWGRQVEVRWVAASDLTTSLVGIETGVKRIEVRVTEGEKLLATVVAIRSTAAAAVDPREQMTLGAAVAPGP